MVRHSGRQSASFAADTDYAVRSAGYLRADESGSVPDVYADVEFKPPARNREEYGFVGCISRNRDHPPSGCDTAQFVGLHSRQRRREWKLCLQWRHRSIQGYCWNTLLHACEYAGPPPVELAQTSISQ